MHSMNPLIIIELIVFNYYIEDNTNNGQNKMK